MKTSRLLRSDTRRVADGLVGYFHACLLHRMVEYSTCPYSLTAVSKTPLLNFRLAHVLTTQLVGSGTRRALLTPLVRLEPLKSGKWLMSTKLLVLEAWFPASVRASSTDPPCHSSWVHVLLLRCVRCAVMSRYFNQIAAMMAFRCESNSALLMSPSSRRCWSADNLCEIFTANDFAFEAGLGRDSSSLG